MRGWPKGLTPDEAGAARQAVNDKLYAVMYDGETISMWYRIHEGQNAGPIQFASFADMDAALTMLRE